MKKYSRIVSGHYTVSLPFQLWKPIFSDSRCLAVKLSSLNSSLLMNSNL